MQYLFIIIICLLLPYTGHSIDVTLQNAPAQVYFSPGGGATDAIVNEIGNAKSEVLVQAYSFTSAPIARALVYAHKRGVHVEIILDRSQKSERYSSADFTAHAGILTYIDAQHAIAHNNCNLLLLSHDITA
ncbi:MAG: phospholipase D-like domain-containing protein [Dissulfurispiraceae bacterium]